MVGYVSAGDKEAFQIGLDSGYCFILKGGDRVHIEDIDWSGIYGVRSEGSTTTIWVLKEAVD